MWKCVRGFQQDRRRKAAQFWMFPDTHIKQDKVFGWQNQKGKLPIKY